MRCSNFSDGCYFDGDTLYQCSCSKNCACAVCEDCVVKEGESLTCSLCRSLSELENTPILGRPDDKH